MRSRSIKLKEMTGIDVFPALPDSVKRTVVTMPAPTPHGGYQTNDRGYKSHRYLIREYARHRYSY